MAAAPNTKDTIGPKGTKGTKEIKIFNDPSYPSCSFASFVAAVRLQYDEPVIRADRVIPAVLGEIIRKAPLCPEKVDFAWRSSVGAAVARATTVHLDDNGVLHVTVADGQWGREIKRSSRLILSRLSALLGEGVVKKVSV